jgi:hypothetical protein
VNVKKVGDFFMRGFRLLKQQALNYLYLATNVNSIKDVLVENYYNENLYRNPRYLNNKRLNIYEWQAFSQTREDGIIEEIFNRIGTTNKFFVEFGVGNGLECNTIYLMHKEWKGCWIECSDVHHDFIVEKFRGPIEAKQLTVLKSLVDKENIELLFRRMEVPQEFDLLSIDIDGNDFWVWQAIKNYNPRVVIVEYNASFGKSIEWIMEYNPTYIWDGSKYRGASLKSLEKLGRTKGYNLVGCNFAGTNAFFVRNDLVKDLFEEPFTSENHYEMEKGFLIKTDGPPRNYGSFRREG